MHLHGTSAEVQSTGIRDISHLVTTYGPLDPLTLTVWRIGFWVHVAWSPVFASGITKPPLPAANTTLWTPPAGWCPPMLDAAGIRRSHGTTHTPLIHPHGSQVKGALAMRWDTGDGRFQGLGITIPDAEAQGWSARITYPTPDAFPASSSLPGTQITPPNYS